MWCLKVMPLSASAIGELEIVEDRHGARALDLRIPHGLQP